MMDSVCPKMCHKNYENGLQKIVCVQTWFAQTREIIKNPCLNSGKVVNFIHTFEPLVGFLYYLMLVLSILDQIFKLFIFQGKK